MVSKIEKKEIMTVDEMMERYQAKWFEYVPVNDKADKGYVIYTADSQEELETIPIEELVKMGSISWVGNGAYHTPRAGGIRISE